MKTKTKTKTKLKEETEAPTVVEVEEVQEPTLTQPELPSEQNNSINFEDLQAVVQIIDISCSRGAFRGEELEKIGQIYNTITNFLSSVTAAQEAAAKAEGKE